MNKKLLATSLAGALTTGSLGAAQAASENVTIYGWLNQSYEWVDNDSRQFDRIQSNAGNIGFRGSFDTGVGGVSANFQCEQFIFLNRFAGNSGWCNRNSKVSLSGSFGEIMYGTWLLPANEMIAQWIDPFYDAGLDSHSSLIGSVGYGTLFYNTGEFNFQRGGDFRFQGIFDTGFNRRQEEIVQYFSPNLNGLTFRAAVTASPNRNATNGLDPRIFSGGVAYETGPLWLAVTGQYHKDWTAAALTGGSAFASLNNVGGAAASDADESDDWTVRVAGRYILDWGGGRSTTLAAVYEYLEYDLEGNTVATLYDDLKKHTAFGSVKHKLGGPWDIRLSGGYAFEFDCGEENGSECGPINADQDTDAWAFNAGVFYQLGPQTELRLTYSHISNSDNANYDFGIGGGGVGVGDKVRAVAAGIIIAF